MNRKNLNKAIFSLTMMLFSFSCRSFAADILLIDAAKQPTIASQQVDLIAKFYGLNIMRKEPGANVLTDSEDSSRLEETGGIVITADALPHMDIQKLLLAVQKKFSHRPPIFIMGLTAKMNPSLVRALSGGAVKKIGQIEDPAAKPFYRFSDDKKMTFELAGQTLTGSRSAKRYEVMVINEQSHVKPILEIVRGEGLVPVYLMTQFNGITVFLETNYGSLSEAEAQGQWRYDADRFVEVAPLMMFVRYAFGDRIWHSIDHYANLTIDDPWLTEPYGYLSYKGLLHEMEKVNFHTTIAFIPWNYGRNKEETAALFRDNQSRFSLCIHGNNHDHREFYKYKADPSDFLSFPAKSLEMHEANIKQALARMDKMSGLNRLPYDRVMIFPHGIAPEETLGLLKKYNFLATINTGNIPLGATKATRDALAQLRSVTLKYGNFPSLTRYSIAQISKESLFSSVKQSELDKSKIATELFLGNPILFAGHHDLFIGGIDAFNKTALAVNAIQPDIKWTSLANIVRHLYVERRRYDGNYDILTYSSDFIIQNKHESLKKFHIYKEEAVNIPIKILSIDGKPIDYKINSGVLMLTVTVPPMTSRQVKIEYANNYDSATTDISTKGLFIAVFRLLSDFRDMVLSKNIISRKLVMEYYSSDAYKYGTVPIIALTLLLIISGLATFITWRLFRRYRNKIECLKDS